jgi:hypothetical protein
MHQNTFRTINSHYNWLKTNTAKIVKCFVGVPPQRSQAKKEKIADE